MDMLRAIRSIPVPGWHRPRSDAGMSLIGIVLALAAIGLIVIAAVIAFVIPN